MTFRITDPFVFDLVFRQGSTFDRTFPVYDALDEDGEPDLTQPTDFSACTGATMKVRKDKGSAATIISLALIVGLSSPPAEDGILLSAGAVRVYLRDETLAAIAHTAWTDLSEGESPDGPFAGVWDLEIENELAERYRFAEGRARFSREVTH